MKTSRDPGARSVDRTLTLTLSEETAAALEQTATEHGDVDGGAAAILDQWTAARLGGDQK